MSDSTGSGPERVRWVVRGRVQGVGFRWSTCRLAGPLGLVGFVRNLPDGSVEVVAEGPPDRLNALREALVAGPGFARVESVEITVVSHEVDIGKSFDIR